MLYTLKEEYNGHGVQQMIEHCKQAKLPTRFAHKQNVDYSRGKTLLTMVNTHYYWSRSDFEQFVGAQADPTNIQIQVVGNRPHATEDYANGDKMCSSMYLQSFVASSGAAHSNPLEDIFNDDYFSVCGNTWKL